MKFQAAKLSPSDRIRFNLARAGLGALEVLVVIATLALLLIFLVIPSTSHSSRRKANRMKCVSNLKQIGLSVWMWARDHGDEFPWAVSITSNGVKELAFSGDVAEIFRSMSNELTTPKVLTCPDDSKGYPASDWAKLNNGKISYFIGLDANGTNREMILSGDRNLSGGVFTSNRIMEVRATNALIWRPGMHYRLGFIGLSDGSVQAVGDGELQAQVATQAKSIPVARFAFP